MRGMMYVRLMYEWSHPGVQILMNRDDVGFAKFVIKSDQIYQISPPD